MAKPKILKSEMAFRGGHIQVRVDRVIEPAGHETTREIVVHPGAVCIVARPGNDDVILIRQYRHSTGGELLEIPAGGLDPGEDPLNAARRELEEETGYNASTIIPRASFWTTPGFTTEYMWLYEATGLEKTKTNPDEDEVIEVDIVKITDALQMIQDGRIRDAKTILGLLHVFRKT
jgi:ADP-ribose pyrophosphatase